MLEAAIFDRAADSVIGFILLSAAAV